LQSDGPTREFVVQNGKRHQFGHARRRILHVGVVFKENLPVDASVTMTPL